MFCINCGQRTGDDDKFCVHCGKSIHHTTLTSSEATKVKPFPFVKYFLTVLLMVSVTFAGYTLINEIIPETDTTETPYSDLDDEYLTVLGEMGSHLEPVGYFDDMSKFDSDLGFGDWLSHIKYFEYQDKPLTDKNRKFAAVVKIVCEDEEFIYYGSGTNVDAAGYVLTNHHVVEGLETDSCMVGFPNPETGLIKEAYWATTVIDEANETGHDLAYLVIERPVFDEEGNVYGYYDKISNGKLPYFEHIESCLDVNPELGDGLYILGYPPLSGGSLTVTNGLVSSLYSQDGYIVTSAKIVSGNSGGLAVDNNGCYIGVPTAIYFDDQDVNQELFGEIIDAEFVIDFDRAIEDDLQKYYIDNGIVF